jgi:hypothetical protein
MQRKILASPKKGVGNHRSWKQSEIFHLNNTQCPWCYPLSKNPKVKKKLEIKKR